MLSVFATPYFDGLVQERCNSSASLEFNERKTFSEIGHLQTLLFSENHSELDTTTILSQAQIREQKWSS